MTEVRVICLWTLFKLFGGWACRETVSKYKYVILQCLSQNVAAFILRLRPVRRPPEASPAEDSPGEKKQGGVL